MANKKTSTKRTKSPKKSTSNWVDVGGGVMGLQNDSTQWIKDNPKSMFKGLVEAFAEGDKEAVQDILGAIIRTSNITKIAKEAKLSRAVIYEAIDHSKNPSLQTMCKIMRAFQPKEGQSKAS